MTTVASPSIMEFTAEDTTAIIAIFAAEFRKDPTTLSLDTQITRDLGGFAYGDDDQTVEAAIGEKFFAPGMPGHLNGQALWDWKPETIRDFLTFIKLSQELQPGEQVPQRLVPRMHYTLTQVLHDVTVAVGMALGVQPAEAVKKIVPHEAILSSTRLKAPAPGLFPLDDLHETLQGNFRIELGMFKSSLTPYTLASRVANRLGKQGRMI